MALSPLPSCPHCPPNDPLLRELEATVFYDGQEFDSFDNDEESESAVCCACRRLKEGHPPPYGPWCRYRNGSTSASTSPSPPPLPRLRHFRARNLRPLIEACLGTGSIGTAFVAHYRQKHPSGEGEDILNLVVKRIGEDNQDFFDKNEEGRKSSDPTIAAVKEKLTTLKHIHLIKVYGIIGGNKIVMERAAYGGLIGHLCQDSAQNSMNRHHLVYVAFQIAAAMAFLEKNAVIHGRLAARNALVCEVSKCRRWIHVKLTDFGIPLEYRKSRESRLPWKSPEEIAIESSPSTSSSDCWSFGVVLHEIFTFGKEPYDGLNFVTLRKWIPQGYRMLQDPLVPDKIYFIMRQCWEPASLKRPSFHQLEYRLWNLFKEVTPDFLCDKCGDIGIAGGLGTRTL